MVAGGGPAATNLGRLANGVSTSLGFRAPGAVTASDAPRPYLAGGVDSDLRVAAAQLGLNDMPGGGHDTAATPSDLRNAGRTLSRQVCATSSRTQSRCELTTVMAQLACSKVGLQTFVDLWWRLLRPERES